MTKKALLEHLSGNYFLKHYNCFIKIIVDWNNPYTRIKEIVRYLKREYPLSCEIDDNIGFAFSEFSIIKRSIEIYKRDDGTIKYSKRAIGVMIELEYLCKRSGFSRCFIKLKRTFRDWLYGNIEIKSFTLFVGGS